MYRIWNLAYEAVEAGAPHENITSKMRYIMEIEVSKAETDGQLLALIEDAEPKWYSLTKPE